MGRKQKLRLQKQARRNLENVTSVAPPTPPTPPTSSTQPIPRLTSSSAIPINESNSMFPKSRFFNLSQHLDASGTTKYNRLVNGAEEHGCVHCMMLIGRTIEMNSNTNGMTNVHYAQPWFLEGSIRGSFVSTVQLVGIYNKVIAHKPLALASYWVKMNNKYHKWNDCSKRQSWNDIQDYINRKCIVCSKSDTQTLTLRHLPILVLLILLIYTTTTSSIIKPSLDSITTSDATSANMVALIKNISHTLTF